jgi:hypothetical protein
VRTIRRRHVERRHRLHDYTPAIISVFRKLGFLTVPDPIFYDAVAANLAMLSVAWEAGVHASSPDPKHLHRLRLSSPSLPRRHRHHRRPLHTVHPRTTTRLRHRWLHSWLGCFVSRQPIRSLSKAWSTWSEGSRRRLICTDDQCCRWCVIMAVMSRRRFWITITAVLLAGWLLAQATPASSWRRPRRMIYAGGRASAATSASPSCHVREVMR